MTGATPSQTVGPFFSFGLSWLETPHLVPPGDSGAISIVGSVLNGDGLGVSDAVVEIFQADARGHFGSKCAAGWTGFGRVLTSEAGRFAFTTTKPGPLPSPRGLVEAPHIAVSVFARGLLQRVITRIYFPDEAAANNADPVLGSIAPDRRQTLVARTREGGLRFDVRLQGENETVFFNC